MVEELEKIAIIDKTFKFVEINKEKFIYQNIDKELEQVNILELEFSNKEQRIKKIDIYTLADSDLISSLHITRGIDGITEIDYYPINEEYVTINGRKEPCNIDIHQIYKEDGTNSSLEYNELTLTHRGSKKHKKLTGLTIQDDLFITPENKTYQISTYSISKLKQLTEFLIPSIIEIEKKMFNLKEEKLIEEHHEEIGTLVLDNIDEYPDSLYVYDRNYYIAGVRNKALVYADNYDNIELEIYFNDLKTRINEVRFVSGKDNKDKKTKKRIIRLIKTNDNKIKTTLCNRKKESIYLNDHDLDKVSIRAESIVSENGKIEWMNVIIDSQFGKFDLIESHNIGVGFTDNKNKEYRLSSSTYLHFRMMSILSPNIIKTLEKKLVLEEKKQKKLLMQN